MNRVVGACAHVALRAISAVRFGAILLVAAGSVQAATFVVNSTLDDSDLDIANPGFDGICDTGSGGAQAQCTLRAAIEEANAAAGPHSIVFDIPSADPNCNVASGVCVIKLTWENLLPDIRQTVTIDGSTQPGNAAVCSSAIANRPDYKIVLEGDSAEINAIDSNILGGIGLRLEEGSDGSTIRGLNLRNFSDAVALIRSNNSKVACNFIGTNESGTAAGHSSGAGNQLNGVILGCKSTGNVIGGESVNDGNLIAASKVNGVQLYGDIPCNNGEAPLPLADRSPDGNAILGNFIGTQKNGTSPLGHAFDTISMFGGDGPDNNLVGLMNDGAGGFLYNPNVLAASLGGIYIDSDVSGAVIAGNFIGTDLTRTVNLGNVDGIYIVGSGSATVARIGGPLAADENVIALNTASGIVVLGAAASVHIQRNSIYDNVNVGIDLVPVVNPANPFSDPPDNATANDAGDADTGPNALQNFPEQTLATLGGGNVSITYSVPSTDLPLTVEFFIADSARQGKTFLGSGAYSAAGVTTLTLPAGALTLGGRIVGTATDAKNNTSEFSAATIVVALASATADTGSDLVDGAAGTPGNNLFANDTGSSFTLTSIGGCSAFPCTLNVLNAAAAIIGSVTVQSDGNYSFTASAIGVGVALSYNATDSTAQSVSATLTLTGLAPGAPIATTDTALVTSNTTFTQSQSILGNDSGNGITLVSVTGNGAPCSAFACTITTAHGSATVAANGTYTYTPATGYVGNDSFSYTIADIAAQSAVGTVNLTVVAAPAASTAVAVPTTSLAWLIAFALGIALLARLTPNNRRQVRIERR